MPRVCTICPRDDRAEIDSFILRGLPNRAIARRFIASRHALDRHRLHIVIQQTMTWETLGRLKAALSQGLTLKAAATLSKISYTALQRWLTAAYEMEADRDAAQAHNETKQLGAGTPPPPPLVRPGDGESFHQPDIFAGDTTPTPQAPYRVLGPLAAQPERPQPTFFDLLDTINDAEAAFQLTLLAHLNQHKDWRARAWVAERRFASTFGERTRHEHTGKNGGPIEITVDVSSDTDPEDAIDTTAVDPDDDEDDLQMTGIG